jgi:hypothetical protein
MNLVIKGRKILDQLNGYQLVGNGSAPWWYNINICTDVLSSQTFKSYFHGVSFYGHEI